MSELFWKAAGGDPDAISGIAALISVLALLPAAAIFIVNQILQNVQLREGKYRYLHDQYMQFLSIALEHPEFDLEHGSGSNWEKLKASEKRQLFVAFEIYTAILEAAFKLYEYSYTSNKRTQWQGWISYARRYIARPDYQEFLSAALFQEDVKQAIREGRQQYLLGRSEYDTKFEQFLLSHMSDLESARE